MITKTFKFYTPEEKLPEKSCTYLVHNGVGYYSTVPYSKEHNAFNCYDYFNKEESNKYKIDAKMWAYIDSEEDDVV